MQLVTARWLTFRKSHPYYSNVYSKSLEPRDCETPGKLQWLIIFRKNKRCFGDMPAWCSWFSTLYTVEALLELCRAHVPREKTMRWKMFKSQPTCLKHVERESRGPTAGTCNEHMQGAPAMTLWTSALQNLCTVEEAKTHESAPVS